MIIQVNSTFVLNDVSTRVDLSLIVIKTDASKVSGTHRKVSGQRVKVSRQRWQRGWLLHCGSICIVSSRGDNKHLSAAEKVSSTRWRSASKLSAAPQCCRRGGRRCWCSRCSSEPYVVDKLLPLSTCCGVKLQQAVHLLEIRIRNCCSNKIANICLFVAVIS